MNIRLMQPKDLPQVALLEQQCFSQPWSEAGLKSGLERPDGIFLVAEDEEETILGYAGLYSSFEEGEITNVAVAPGARRQGIGRLLMEEMHLQARKRELTCIFLEVRVSNQPAIALYQGLGYEELALRKNLYEFPTEDGYFMKVDFIKEKHL